VESVDRIIPLDGDLAEVVFALGLGDRVVATDLSATYPAEADALPEIGYQRALSAEPIAAFEPTLLLATDLAGPAETLDQLRALGFPLVMIDRPLDASGPATKIRQVADALGVSARGQALAREVQGAIDFASEAGAAAFAAGDRPRAMALYLRGQRVQVVFGKNSGLDRMIEAAGAVDVGTELGVVDNAPLTAESVVRAAPEVFLVSTAGLESVGDLDGFLAIPGIAQTPAGEAARVIAHDDQYLFGGGPRAGMLLAELVGALHPGTGSTPPASVPTTPTTGD
jgi:iron complex transport system substrate-binding protein